MFLQHISYGYNDEQILKDGFLRPANKTKISNLYASQDKNGNQVFSNWIYTRLNTNLDKRDGYADFYISPDILLKTKFVLHSNWKTEDNIVKSNIIDGTLLTKKNLYELLNNFKEISRLNFLNRIILAKKEDKKIIKSSSDTSNEILIKDDIDLHKYLVMYSDRDDKVVNEIIKNKYPNVKLI
jgi:hypothetical protein